MPIFLTWIYIFSVNNSFLWYDKALACAVRLLLNILIFISINFFIFAVMMMIIRMIVVLISKIMISDSVNDYEIGSNKVKGNKWSDTDTVEKIRIQMLRVMVTTTMILCYKLTKKKKKNLLFLSLSLLLMSSSTLLSWSSSLKLSLFSLLFQSSSIFPKSRQKRHDKEETLLTKDFQ